MPDTYFPCQQNQNHTIPQLVENFFIDNYIQDGDKFILGNFDNYFPGTETTKFYYFCRWKTVEVTAWMRQDYEFCMQKGSDADARFWNGVIRYDILDATVTLAETNAYNIIFSPLPLVSSDYDIRISYISNVDFYNEDDELLILYPYDEEPETTDFTINNVWMHGTWTSNGLTNPGAQNFRLVKGKVTPGAKISFYKRPGVVDGKLQLGVITSGSLIGMSYSEDGVNWTDTNVFPYTYFYRQRETEIGTFDFGVSFYSSIPVFKDKTTAQKYINNDPSVSIEDAENWPDISGEYPSVNPTGSALPASVFGDVKLKGFFSQQYICDSTCLSAIANDLFNTAQGGIWESMKKGLDMYGASAIDAVMGLSFWPFNVSDFIGAGNYAAAEYIWFGGYGWETAGHGTCNQIIYASGYKDIGTLRVVPKYHSWRDYEPYTKLYVSIPYCGTYQLDIGRYLGKDIRFRYFIDTRTNGCICALIADGYLMDYFNGQMGVTMPITLTDYAAYMNSQMQVLLQGGGQAMGTFGNAAGTVGQVAPLGTAGLLAGGAVAAGGAALSGAAIGAKTIYGLSQNNINNFNKTKGGSSSMINCYLPQTIDLIFEYQEDIYTDSTTRRSTIASDYYPYFGAPSMKTGQINMFTGFLKCQSVKLECGIATERERERLKQMLLSGIYI